MKRRRTDTDDKDRTPKTEKKQSGDNRSPVRKKSPKRTTSRATAEALQLDLPDAPAPPAEMDAVFGKTPEDNLPGTVNPENPARREYAADPGAAHDEVFLDIITKAREGNIKYQELYLKYIDLITEKGTQDDEIIYEATFIDDKDKKA